MTNSSGNRDQASKEETVHNSNSPVPPQQQPQKEEEEEEQQQQNEERKKMMMMMTSSQKKEKSLKKDVNNKNTKSSSSLSYSWKDYMTIGKYVYSTLLLLFCIVVVVALIFENETAMAQNVHASLAVCLLWIMIVWLSIVEGGQGALVGLGPVQPSLYQHSHPYSYQCTKLIHFGGSHHHQSRLDQYLIGRQFLVILLVFVINQCGAPVDGTSSVWDWPPLVQEIVVRSSLAIILVTVMMGQLHSQVNASNCMLDYINVHNRVMVFTLYVSLALEASGAMHAVYLLQYAFAKLSKQQSQPQPPGQEDEEEEDDNGDDGDKENSIVDTPTKATTTPKNHENDEEKQQPPPNHDSNIMDPKKLGGESAVQKKKDSDETLLPPPPPAPPVSSGTVVFFWFRVVFSVALLFISLAVTLTALWKGQTNMWEGIPVGVSIVLFVFLMVVLGILEGTQIAVFAVSRLPMEELMQYPKTVLRCIDVLLLQNDGQNIPRFMIGRQIMVTLLMFIIARVTTVNVNTDDTTNDEDTAEDTIWGVPKGVQEFFNTGLLGAIIVTIVGAISWKLVGSAFPVLFLSNPMVYCLIQIALALEASGICSGAWVLAKLHAKLAGLQPDEQYIGTPQDRAAQQTPDSNPDLSVASGGSSRRLPSANHPDSGDANVQYGNPTIILGLSRLNLGEPMHPCGSSRYLQVDEVSKASSRYLLGNNSIAGVDDNEDENDDLSSRQEDEEHQDTNGGAKEDNPPIMDHDPPAKEEDEEETRATTPSEHQDGTKTPPQDTLLLQEEGNPISHRILPPREQEAEDGTWELEIELQPSATTTTAAKDDVDDQYDSGTQLPPPS